MITIALIRHGRTDWNDLNRAQGLRDIPLNNKGKCEVLQLAKRLVVEEKWDIIISSPLDRTMETANIISKEANGVPVILDERLREIDAGLIEGTTEEERIVRWGIDWRNKELLMESSSSVTNRGMEAINDIKNKYKNKKVLIVSHGALIGLTLKGLLPEIFTKTNIDNTSLTTLLYSDNKWSCTLYNCTKHLLEVKER